MNSVIAMTYSGKTTQIEHKNVFKFTGSAVHIYHPKEDVTILTIAVGPGPVHPVDYPNVTFHGTETARAIDAEVCTEKGKYSRVTVTGTVQTSRGKGSDGKKEYRQTFVGNTISHSQTIMEELSGREGVGSRKSIAENKICIIGEVVKLFPIKKPVKTGKIIGALLTLKTQLNGYTNYPRMTIFGPMANDALEANTGDTVCVTGFAETASKANSNGKQQRFETIIVSEIAHIDE